MGRRLALWVALLLGAAVQLGLALGSGAEALCLIQEYFSPRCATLLPSGVAVDWPALAVASHLTFMAVLLLGGLGHGLLLLVLLRADGEPGRH